MRRIEARHLADRFPSHDWWLCLTFSNISVGRIINAREPTRTLRSSRCVLNSLLIQLVLRMMILMRKLLPLGRLIDHDRPIAAAVHPQHRLLSDTKRHISRMLLRDIYSLGKLVVISLVYVTAYCVPLVLLVLVLLLDCSLVIEVVLLLILMLGMVLLDLRTSLIIVIVVVVVIVIVLQLLVSFIPRMLLAMPTSVLARLHNL